MRVYGYLILLHVYGLPSLKNLYIIAVLSDILFGQKLKHLF